MAKRTVTKQKAKEILRHGEIRGKPLTEAQRGFFGARAGGAPSRPMGRPSKRRRRQGRHGTGRADS